MEVLYLCFATNTPSTDLDILELFVVDPDDMVICTKDVSLLGRDDLDQNILFKGCINYLHYTPEFRHNVSLV